uniref:Trem-like transcript 2 protein n=1 Tax=Microcebus murinus TaxID=30608 RepID=A0A8B7G2J0_MICMU|nr:trem-like transcript 2 protein [Microcebus murinus]XP_012616274.1 trem-like transcript 2 protein [Microcebus murinus]
MPPATLLLLLLWLQGCVSGLPAESAYTKVKLLEGETLSVQCSYKGYKNRVEGKVWCKIRRKRCEPGFTRAWVKGPRYLLQDDAQVKVVNITMVALKSQDSGRYWCMRNTSGTLYPLMGIQLEVSPGSAAERSTPLTHLADVFKSGIVAAGQAPSSGPDVPSATGRTGFTPGILTLARLLPSSSPTSMPGYSFTGASLTTTGPRRTAGGQTATAPPRNAGASSVGSESISSESGHLGTRVPVTVMCHTSRSLDKFPSLRNQDFYPTVLVMGLTFLLVPVMLVVVYGLWKKRHVGSYSIRSDPARPWKDPPRRPEPPWKLAWSETT